MRWQSDNRKANLCQAQQGDLKTLAPLSHRPIVLTDTIDYRTIVFLHYRPNPNKWPYLSKGLTNHNELSRNDAQWPSEPYLQL